MAQPNDNKTHRLTDMTVEEVSLVDRAANKWSFILTKRDEDGVVIVPDGNGGYTQTEKAVWDTAYVNDLPDSAFLYIKPGGAKDETGRTVPRALRMFPYKDATGKIDLPHLRNAIARIPQANIPQDLKDKLQTRARALLEQAQKVSGSTTKDSNGDTAMTIKLDFTTIAKAAPQEDFDKITVEKQVGAASAKLNQILGALALNPSAVLQMDKYDIRHAVGESINILIQAAKLENMLGQTIASQLQMQAKNATSDEATEPETPPEQTTTGTETEAQSEQSPTIDTTKFNEMVAQFSEMIKDFKAKKAVTPPAVVQVQQAKSDEKIGKQLSELADSVKTLKSKLIQQKKSALPRRNGADVEEMNKTDPKPMVWEMDIAKSLDEEPT